MPAVIQVENLSKLHRLDEVSTGTLSHDLNRWWHKVRGKEDSYLKIGQVNDRTKRKAESDWVWALNDINFSVSQGEVLGIIGRNGAGKSSLLKILSRVTAATSGRIKVKGRIASLSEVGTGVDPELTGRENVFLNGAILGMPKAEIRYKFDEIEKFIDTPVKRYSSGMYVRLAFAVAAHLEPEILIVDEVLAVVDQQFQDKCIGKMQEVSRGGRTILFVSHQMETFDRLTSKCLWMQQGSVYKVGPTKTVVAEYMNAGQAKAAGLSS
jgi:lipopolysaccharide transport system ATP-binding protein